MKKRKSDFQKDIQISKQINVKIYNNRLSDIQTDRQDSPWQADIQTDRLTKVSCQQFYRQQTDRKAFK